MDMKGFTISRLERDGVVLPRSIIETKEAEQVAGLRLVLSYGTGSVRGVVKVESGSVPLGAQIIVRVTRPGENFSYFRQPHVDARGRFLTERLPPGVYDLTVSIVGSVNHNVKQAVNVQDGVVTDVVVTIDLGIKPLPIQ